MIDSADEVLQTNDFTAALSRLESDGFCLDVIFPADEPRVAQLHKQGYTIRLEGPDHRNVTTGEGDEFAVTRGGAWGEGRAGMDYRDLIPNRHGGAVIASHIRIPEPGPVPDYVHHHDIDFQMIYCRHGRVQVVYQDQGEEFWMEAGDCVLQPPHIRHRVLASDGGCEVVEIASPAEHPTFIEHDITLPTAVMNPNRNFGGQRFSFDRSADMDWVDDGNGWQTQTTGIAAATSNAASVTVIKATAAGVTMSGSHDGELFMFYILEGSAAIVCDDSTNELTSDDSVAIPRCQTWELTAGTKNFEVLVIAMADS